MAELSNGGECRGAVIDRLSVRPTPARSGTVSYSFTRGTMDLNFLMAVSTDNIFSCVRFWL